MDASPHAANAAELKRVLDAERGGGAFLLLRDGEGDQAIVALDPAAALTIGRRSANDVALAWDDEASRVHCRLEYVGGEWTVSDEGLSRNGTFVNEERVVARRRLRDGEVIRVGTTLVLFRDPAAQLGESSALTAEADTSAAAAPLTERQRAVLAALARPFVGAPGLAAPASNRTIAAEVHLGVDAVKGHLRVLYARFELDSLPQPEKRVRLAEQALRAGLVHPPRG